MNDYLDPLAVAKQPTQRRAKERFDSILREAEALLIEKGLNGFSIPLLAERLGYTRGSVYAYFPTHYAILNELAARNLVELEAVFYSRAAELQKLDWRAAVESVVDQAVEFHNSHPAASMLILGGAVTDDSYRAQEMTIQRLGNLGRTVWSQKGLVFGKSSVDVATLSVDIATACMRRSYFEHGKVTRPYRDAAVSAMIAFLAAHVSEPAARTRTRSRK